MKCKNHPPAAGHARARVLRRTHIQPHANSYFAVCGITTGSHANILFSASHSQPSRSEGSSLWHYGQVSCKVVWHDQQLLGCDKSASPPALQAADLLMVQLLRPRLLACAQVLHSASHLRCSVQLRAAGRGSLGGAAPRPALAPRKIALQYAAAEQMAMSMPTPAGKKKLVKKTVFHSLLTTCIC